METVMNGIGKNADYYRGYLTDDRSFGPLAFALAIAMFVAIGFYFTGELGRAPVYDSLVAAQAVHATEGAWSPDSASARH